MSEKDMGRGQCFFACLGTWGRETLGGGGVVSHAPLPFFIWEVIDLQLFLTSVTLIWRKWYKSILSSTFLAPKKRRNYNFISLHFHSIQSPKKSGGNASLLTSFYPMFTPLSPSFSLLFIFLPNIELEIFTVFL